MKITFIILGVLAVIVSIGIFLYSNGSLSISLKRPTEPTSTGTQANESAPTPSENAMFSGTLQLLKEDLGIFKVTEGDEANNNSDVYASYYSAGVYTSGEMRGYTRIIATRMPLGPGSPLIYTLATKDFKTYVVDDPRGYTKLPPEDNMNPYSVMDTAKVTGAKILPTDFPPSIPEENNLSLFRLDIPVEMNSQTESLAPMIVATPHDPNSEIPSTTPDVALYADLKAPSQTYQDATYTQIAQQYLAGSTAVTAVDNTGLPYSYALVYTSDIAPYEAGMQTFDTQYAAYAQEVAEYNKTKTGVYPTSYPSGPESPSLQTKKADITTTETTALYDTYNIAFPYGCFSGPQTKLVKGVEESDLQKIGTVNGQDIYTLKDPDHPLNKLAYYVKIEQTAMMMGTAPDKPADKVLKSDGTKTTEVAKPTYEQYVASNPLLFFYDPWGHLVALGEYDYQLAGGCGKPVVYLYPPKETNVSVQLAVPAVFSTTIPTYSNGWYVRAKPNGELTDLQPEKTDCATIDTSHVGSEYASEACKNNIYPYLYWSGDLVSHDYPNIDTGWVVKRGDLQSFLTAKLRYIGLNEKEVANMTSYWVPYMQKYDAPFFRLSLLQNDELASYMPYVVSPQPDTTIRVFLDFSPLTQAPTQKLMAPKLVPYSRQGFTFVEWGGKK